MPSSFQSQTFSSSTSSINGQTTSYTQHTQSDATGTRVHRTTSQPGQAPREERFEMDRSGRRIADGAAAGRITDVTDAEEREQSQSQSQSQNQEQEQKRRQEENDRLYEERMEEEYAKREGGA